MLQNNQKMIGEGIHLHVGLNVALDIQEQRKDSVSRLESFHVVGNHSVEKALPVFTGHHDLTEITDVSNGNGFSQSPIFLFLISVMRRDFYAEEIFKRSTFLLMPVVGKNLHTFTMLKFYRRLTGSFGR